MVLLGHCSPAADWSHEIIAIARGFVSIGPDLSRAHFAGAHFVAGTKEIALVGAQHFSALLEFGDDLVVGKPHAPVWIGARRDCVARGTDRIEKGAPRARPATVMDDTEEIGPAPCRERGSQDV